MSFFNEILKNFNINSITNEIMFNMVVGVGVSIVGSVDLVDFDTEKISVDFGKKKFQITGSDMKIESISRGEIIIVGNVCEIVRG